jgi:hypothetical protein
VTDVMDGRCPRSSVTEEANETLQNMCFELLETREGNKTTLANNTKSGRTIHCEWYNTPLVDPSAR